jgi:predicted aspartyl protease
MSTHYINLNIIPGADGKTELILVPILVNGSKLGQMLLDSGSNRTVFDAENVSKWRIPTNYEAVPVSIHAAGGKVIDTYPQTLTSISLGQTLNILNFPALFGNIFGPDDPLLAGILGMDFLSRFYTWEFLEDDSLLVLQE